MASSCFIVEHPDLGVGLIMKHRKNRHVMAIVAKLIQMVQTKLGDLHNEAKMIHFGGYRLSYQSTSGVWFSGFDVSCVKFCT